MNFLDGKVTGIIIGFAGMCLTLLIISMVTAHHIDKSLDEKTEARTKKWVYHLADICYTMFVTIISIFPLLGMLGTVSALLNIDMTGETEALKNNFFKALDTTFWGIIFAVIFKLVNALFQTYIETQIEKARLLLKGDYTRPKKNKGVIGAINEKKTDNP